MPDVPNRSLAYRPRNPEATRELLLDAAADEFATYGYAGARIDRIADAASTNKRMIYAYFGDKDGIFDAVIKREVAALMEATPIAGDLAAFAASRFDFLRAHPRVRLLAAWRTLERGEATDVERASYRARVDAVQDAQRDGLVTDAIPAVDLFALVLRMTEAWLSAPPALVAATPSGRYEDDRIDEHRAALVEAVRRVTDPHGSRS
jgi:AcrR family transcriptional regulator